MLQGNVVIFRETDLAGNAGMISGDAGPLCWRYDAQGRHGHAHQELYAVHTADTNCGPHPQTYDTKYKILFIWSRTFRLDFLLLQQIIIIIANKFQIFGR